MAILFSLIIGLIILALILWALQEAPVIDGTIKSIIRFGCIAIFVVWAVSILVGYTAPLPFLLR